MGRKGLLQALLGSLWVPFRVFLAPAVTNVCDFVPGGTESRANPAELIQKEFIVCGKAPRNFTTAWTCSSLDLHTSSCLHL